MTDKAPFHLSGFFKQADHALMVTSKSWGTASKAVLCSTKVTVWCEVGVFGILDPYLFKLIMNEQWLLTQKLYVTMLEDFVLHPSYDSLVLNLQADIPTRMELQPTPHETVSL